jgi:hypothetical protein
VALLNFNPQSLQEGSDQQITMSQPSAASEADDVQLIPNAVNVTDEVESAHPQDEEHPVHLVRSSDNSEPQLERRLNIRDLISLRNQRNPAIRLLEQAASVHQQRFDEYTFSSKRVPFWKQGPGWQMWVLAFQTVFLFGKLESSFIMGVMWMWMWDWWIVMLPTWIAITAYTGSLIMWIIRDLYKWRKSNSRFQRRLQRHQIRTQHLRTTMPNHADIQIEYVRSSRSERRMLRKRVDRFYACSILLGITALVVSLFMFTLKLDQVANISSLTIIMPLIIFGLVHTILTIIMLGIMWKQSPRNGGSYAIANRGQAIFITSIVFILLSMTAILLTLKIDFQILEFKLGYGACFSPLFVLNGVAWLAAICTLIFSFYDQRQFIDMFKVHRNRFDDEQEADIEVLLERRSRPISIEEKKIITMYRLDVSMFMFLQIPVRYY